MQGSIRRTAAWLFSVLVLVGCGGSSGAATLPPGGPTDGGSGSGGSGQDGLCGLFTLDEIGDVLGASVGPGSAAGPFDSGCQWRSSESGADLMIQKVPVDSWENWEDTEGYQPIEGIGDAAFVVPHPFGRMAGALTGTAAYAITADPPPDDDKELLELLAAFVERSPGPIDAAIPTPVASPDGLSTVAPTTAASAAPGGGTIGCPLTDGQVSAVMTVPMVPQPVPCAWAAGPEFDGGLADVYFMAVPVDAFHADGERAVPGLGDEAYIDGSDVLYVRRGNSVFTIQILAFGPGLPPATEAAVELARIALASPG